MTDRFVILTHDYPVLHWDLMLEEEFSLRTWRLLAEPLSTEPIEAEQLPSHRKLYLDYEGPVSGDRGNVSQWDTGQFQWSEHERDRVVIHLNGKRVCSSAVLTRQSESGNWIFQWTGSDL